MILNYECSSCGEPAYYDGRCGDGPVLMCGCDKTGEYVHEGSRGGYYTNPKNARPIPGDGLAKNWGSGWRDNRD